jgi:hypothetical protein
VEGKREKERERERERERMQRTAETSREKSRPIDKRRKKKRDAFLHSICSSYSSLLHLLQRTLFFMGSDVFCSIGV